MKQLPADLKRDGRLAGAGGHREQDAVVAADDRLQHVVDGVVLVVADLPLAAAGLRRERRRSGRARRSASAKTRAPQLVGRRVRVDVAFGAGLHVDAVDAHAVGGVGEPGLEFFGVAFGLAEAFGVGRVAFFGLDDGQLLAAVDQDVVGDVAAWRAGPRLASRPSVICSRRTRLAFDDAPAGGAQGRVDQLGAGFGFVHEEKLANQPRCIKERNLLLLLNLRCQVTSFRVLRESTQAQNGRYRA